MSAASSKADTPPSSKARKFEALAGLTWAIMTFYSAYYVSFYIFLIHLYGFARVRSEHLHFTDTPKGAAWVVSNGDHITKGHFLHFVVALVLWLALFSVTFPFIHRLLPMREEKDDG